MNEFDIVKFSNLCDRAIYDHIDYMYDVKNKSSVWAARERLMGSIDTISTLIDCMENETLAKYMINYVAEKRKEIEGAYVDALNILRTKENHLDGNQ